MPLDQPELRELLARLQDLVGEAATPLSDNLIPGASEERKPMRRIHGPYQHRANAWRVVEVDTVTRARAIHTYRTEAEAASAAEKLRRDAAKQNGATVEQLLSLYRAHLTAKGNKPRSIETTLYRIGRVLETSRPVASATAVVPDGMAGDSRLNMAAETRTFLRWCQGQGYLSRVPDIKVQARRTKGKAQLRIDEARRWLALALERGEIAACMTLLMGMRASEVADRIVRDLDDGGRLLWIPAAKTRAGVRRLVVPDVLRGSLLKLVSGRPSNEPLFPGATRWSIRRAVMRVCRLARVPMVGPHSMRGLHASLAVASGITAEKVAASLGHESFTTTATHYADPDTLAATAARTAGELLASSPAVPQSDVMHRDSP